MKILCENYGLKNYLKEDHRSYRLRLQKEIPYQPEVFSGFLFAAAKVASISAMIFFPGLLAQLVRTLHWYGGGQRFESRTSLNFLQAFLSQLQTLRLNCDDLLSNNTSGTVTMVREKPFPSFKTRLSTTTFL